MNDKKSERREGDEELYQGLPARLFDCYDGGREPTEAEMRSLIEGAPNLHQGADRRGRQGARGARS